MWLAALLALAMMGACAAPTPGGAGGGEGTGDAPPPPERLTGTVAVVGSDPFPRVVVRPDDGGGAVTVATGQRHPIRRVAGARVLALGRVEGDPRRMHLERFTVLSVDGIPALDGLLERDGEEFVLTTPEGERVRIGSPPRALRAHLGSRVWVAGRDVGTEPEIFGLIDPDP